MKLNNTPIDHIVVNNHSFYIKRDDLLHPDFSGNKARKFQYLLSQDISAVDKIVSFGSTQANSLHSLAVLAKEREIQLEYYVAHISSFLKENPSGNYSSALGYGANIIEVATSNSEDTLQAYVERLVASSSSRTLYVPEGGRYKDAAIGINVLADEIIQWMQQEQYDSLKVALPSGTGTTALFLQKRFCELQLPIEVLTCACVGGDTYLKKQFEELSSNKSHYPFIMAASKKYHFGKLYLPFYQMWRILTIQTGIVFELLYDPLGWLTLLEYVEKCGDETPILYIHQGGILGNETMLGRYRRKYKV
jgi:1-aminocyclopropane-1-carboxylate deaminase